MIWGSETWNVVKPPWPTNPSVYDMEARTRLGPLHPTPGVCRGALRLDDDLDRRRLGVTPPVHRTGRDGAPTCPEGENPAELYTTVSGGDGAQATRSWITRVSPHDLFEGKHIVREGRGNP